MNEKIYIKNIVKVFLYISLSILLIIVLLVACDSALLYPFELHEYVVVEPGCTIAYNELDEPPVYFSDYIAPITKTKLKLYMLVHGLVITSGEYSFENTIRFERLVEILNFADADKTVDNDISETQTETDEKKLYKRVLAGLTLLDTKQANDGVPSMMSLTEDFQRKAVLSFMGTMEEIHAKSYSSIFMTLLSTTEINELFDWIEDNEFLQRKELTQICGNSFCTLW